MKYIIQEGIGNFKHAGTKATGDVMRIAMKIGYIPIFIDSNSMFKKVVYCFRLFQIWKKINMDDEILLQWPLYRLYKFEWFKKVISSTHAKLVVLIHDLNNLRNFGDCGRNDIPLMLIADKIIVHSDNMKNYLINQGVSEGKIVILTTFDYLTEDKIRFDRRLSKEIVYAGNLKKSKFLFGLADHQKDLIVNCYGLPIEGLPKTMNYKCAFSPENVSILEGSWGLVWDGDSINTCNGDFGNYLRYNAPHKLSLYIVAGLPVIVWKQSALAKYVEEKGIGIVIESLSDLSLKINSYTEESYQIMLQNIVREGEILREGGHLVSALTHI